MLLFSTVLFVDGNPIGYKVFQPEENRLVLNPAENPARINKPPTMNVYKDRGTWRVEGTDNIDLIDQVKEDLTLNINLPSRNHLSAAP